MNYIFLWTPDDLITREWHRVDRQTNGTKKETNPFYSPKEKDILPCALSVKDRTAGADSVGEGEVLHDTTVGMLL